MPIKWNTLQVKEATDMIEELVNKAAEPLEQIRVIAREACKIQNIPQYITQDFDRLIGEVDRAIGGSQFEPVGRLRSCVEAIRKSIPEKAAKEQEQDAKNGSTQSLM